MAGLVTQHSRWQYAYYAIGAFAAMAGFVYTVGIRDGYEYYPGIGVGELRLLRASGAAPMPVRAPWSDIACSRAVWAVLAAQIGHSCCFALFTSVMPHYLADCQRLRLDRNTYAQAVGWLLLWLGALVALPLEARLVGGGGSSGDGCCESGGGGCCDDRVSRKCVRVLFNTVGSVPGALFLGLAAGMHWHDVRLVLLLLGLVMLTKGAAYSGFRANVYDLSDNFAGELVAVANLVGIACAVVVPLVWGATVELRSMAEDEWQREYEPVFYGTCGALLAGNVVFAVLSSGELQWWDGVSA